MAALGLDPFRYLEAQDISERMMLVKMCDRVKELRDLMDDNLAINIANRVGKLFSK